MTKRVLVIFAGGAAFSTDGPYAEHGKIQATQEDLEKHITYGVAQDLSSHIKTDLHYMGGSFDGANENAEDWNNLGEVIANSYAEYDGFVVLHGSCTIPWAASQLAYSLQNLAKPVIFTDGSIIEGLRGYNATRQMVITAMQLAAFSNIPEVSVLSSKNILLKGVDSIQENANVHCSFISRNDRILAHIGAEMLYEHGNIKPISHGSFLYVPVDTSIMINMYTAPFAYPMGIAASDDVSGLLIQAGGAGNIPLQHHAIGETLKELKDRRVPVIAITSDVHGYIDFRRVGNRNELEQLNVISGGSMTEAAAFTKLRAAMSMQVPYEEMAEFMKTDMFGETKSRLQEIAVPHFPRQSLEIT